VSTSRNGGALQGDLAQFFPSEVLQLLQLAQATGRLELERSGERAELFVERGRPVFARTSGGAVRAGEILVHRGAITGEVLERALAEQRAHPGERLGTLLVASGVATPEQIQGAVHEALRRIVYGLLLWREGTFRFVPGDQVGAEDVKLDLDLDRLILEGLRQADEARAG
jgi:glycine/D-amino acid oxidase-like deaminating enzyme